MSILRNQPRFNIWTGTQLLGGRWWKSMVGEVGGAISEEDEGMRAGSEISSDQKGAVMLEGT